MGAEALIEVETTAGGESPESLPAVPAVTTGASVLSDPSPEFLAQVPHEFARRHLILSAGRMGEAEVLLAAERTRPTAIFNVGVALDRSIETRTVPAEELAAAIDRAYSEDRARHSRDESADIPAVVVEGARDVESEL